MHRSVIIRRQRWQTGNELFGICFYCFMSILINFVVFCGCCLSPFGRFAFVGIILCLLTELYNFKTRNMNTCFLPAPGTHHRFGNPSTHVIITCKILHFSMLTFANQTPQMLQVVIRLKIRFCINTVITSFLFVRLSCVVFIN